MTTLVKQPIWALSQIRLQFVNGIPARSEAVVVEWLTVDIMTNQIIKDALENDCPRAVILEMLNAINLVKSNALTTLVTRLNSRMSKSPFNYIRRRTPGEWAAVET